MHLEDVRRGGVKKEHGFRFDAANDVVVPISLPLVEGHVSSVNV